MQEVTEITTSLKALAKELNVPVVALSQLSRQVESRDDKPIHKLRTTITNQDDVVVLDGNATVYRAELGI